VAKVRLVGPDVIKGIAITLMVFGHITYIGDSRTFQIILKNYIYTFHMPLFLFVSGYFFIPSSPLLKYFKNTILKIFIPYFIFITIYLLLLSYLNMIGFNASNHIGDLSIQAYLYKVFIHPIGGYWFLHTLVIYQLLLTLSTYVNKKQAGIEKVLIVFIFIFYILKEYLGVGISAENFSFLLLGYILRINKILLPENIFSILLILLFYITYSTTEIKNDFLVHLVWVLSITSIIMYTSNRFYSTFLIRLVSFIGRNTLIILVLHVFFINIFKLLGAKFLILDEGGIVYSISTTVMTVGLSIFSAYVFDYLKLSYSCFVIHHQY